jgi:hypothetical protein
VRRLQRRLIAASLALVPIPAAAHLASTGLGPVYDGAYHFALSPEQFLPIAALALFAGRRGPAQARLVLFALPIGWLAAAFAGIAPPADLQPVLTALALLATGGLLAADAVLPRAATGLAALLLGGICGGADHAASSLDPPSVPATLGGAAAIFVLVALIASLALPLRRAWTLIAVRVAGSWMAALGLLLAGWSIHGRG